MPRATTNKLYRSFVKGLITEAGPLTYPENASIDEDNCVLYQAGNRSRRLGIDFEDAYQNSSFGYPDADMAEKAVNTFVWQSADNNSDNNFLVLQFGHALVFYDLAVTPLSTGKLSFEFDLDGYAVNSQDTQTHPVSFAAGKGFLFVVGETIEPFLISYDTNSQTFSYERIYIQIRDFKGTNDELSNDEEPTTLSPEHNYNLRNQGWLSPGSGGGGDLVTYYDEFGNQSTYVQPSTGPIDQYFTAQGRYPGNNKQWWIAKDLATGTFDPNLLNKFFFGNTRSPRGHYIVEPFNIDRTAVSGVASLDTESIDNRPNCVSFFSGRVWYAINSTVYFSQVLDDKRKAGFCYQEADPTAEDISDLIATDGGIIPIPEMIKVQRILPIGGGMLVFGKNGVWYISGTQAGFTATDITVTKVNPIGTESPDSIVHVQDAGGDFILWFSKVGIQAIQQSVGQFGVIDNRFDNTIISQTTIQGFFNAIPQSSLRYVKSHYDPITNIVQWLFNDGTYAFKHTYNRILNFDLTLKAFYPWTISSDPGLGPWVMGVFQSIDPISGRNKFTRYLTGRSASSAFSFSFGSEKNDTFADWDAQAYNSFVETGYELLDDAMRNKQAMFVFCYFKRTEKTMSESIDGDLDLDDPSSCYLRVKWDWTDSAVSNRWSQRIQVYRLIRVPMLDESDTDFVTGSPLVITRNKVRGHGKAIQFRFENDEIGSDFDLLGWAVPYSGNTSV